MSLDRHARAVASTECSARELLAAAQHFPDEVLAHPCLDLLSLDDPGAVMAAQIIAYKTQISRITEPLAKWHTKTLRRVACEAVLATEEYFGHWRPRVSPPSGGEVLTPLYAVRVALAFCDGNTSALSLNWARRFARSFDESHLLSKRTPDKDRSYARSTKLLADLCSGCCAPNREALWSVVEHAAMFHGSELTDVLFRLRFARRIEELALLTHLGSLAIRRQKT